MAKIILTNEVSGLGSAGDVVEVKNGYARNYLVPQGLAMNWTRGGEAEVEQIRRAREARALASAEEAEEMKTRLEASKIRIEAKSGSGGRLFGSIKPQTVAAAIEAGGFGSVDKRKISVPTIKLTGDHQATVHLHEGVDAEVTLQVVSQR